MGASGGSACIPAKMIDGLTQGASIVDEIEALADAVTKK